MGNEVIQVRNDFGGMHLDNSETGVGFSRFLLEIETTVEFRAVLTGPDGFPRFNPLSNTLVVRRFEEGSGRRAERLATVRFFREVEEDAHERIPEVGVGGLHGLAFLGEGARVHAVHPGGTELSRTGRPAEETDIGHEASPEDNLLEAEIEGDVLHGSLLRLGEMDSTRREAPRAGTGG